MILCRDVFHCTPLELDAQPYERTMVMLDMHYTEKQVIEERRKQASKKKKKK